MSCLPVFFAIVRTSHVFPTWRAPRSTIGFRADECSQSLILSNASLRTRIIRQNINLYYTEMRQKIKVYLYASTSRGSNHTLYLNCKMGKICAERLFICQEEAEEITMRERKARKCKKDRVPHLLLLLLLLLLPTTMALI